MKNAKVLCFAAATVASICACAQQPIVIEAESFGNIGGWTIDPQFMETTGSPYLLAHGLGCPVADATTTLFVEKGGEYEVWARAKNWTAHWSKWAAGTFRVAIDGRELPDVCGAGEDAEWRWERAGAVSLAAGEHTLALCDLTGFDGRCDKIALLPPGAGQETLSKMGAMSDVAAEVRESDLVVVGGGIAGICAAVSAARGGLKVALVQDRPVLGGNNSSEVRVHLGGRQNLGPYPRLGDIVAEIGPAKGGNAREASVYEDDRKLAVVAAEKNISLFLNTKAVAVEKRGDSIESVVGVDVRSGARTRFRAPLFVDATGDGTIGALAGADFRMGREARSETGEASAPEKADMMTMGSSIQWYAKNGGPSSFPKRPWMIDLTDENATASMRGDWDWETGIGRDPIGEAERIRDYGMLLAYSNWAHVKNSPKTCGRFAYKELAWVASVAGRRESRRLMGDVVFSETDIDGERYYPDGTCLTSWSVDLHFPRKAGETKFAGEPFRAATVHKKVKSCPIPYRAFYSRNVSNLFMAGRDISVTHAALGTIRVMRTTGMIGEVVGMAATVCTRQGCSPREVYTAHFDELKSMMAKGAGLGRPQPPQNYNEGFTLGISEKATGAACARPLKVLMIGNSFSICVLAEMPKIAKDLGLPLDICSLYIGGCPLERHARNMKAPETHPYRVTWSYVSADKDSVPFLPALTRSENGKEWRGNIPSMLSADNWDVVTIQQASGDSWRFETYEPHGTELLTLISKLAPQAKVYVQQTWSYTPWEARLAKWGIDQDEMFARLEVAYGKFAQSHGLAIIPTGRAIQLYRKSRRDLYGENFSNDVCGEVTFAQENGVWRPKGDLFHLNAKGRYLQGLVWTATLFGVDVEKSTYLPECLNDAPEEAAEMRRLAMSVGEKSR